MLLLRLEFGFHLPSAYFNGIGIEMNVCAHTMHVRARSIRIVVSMPREHASIFVALNCDGSGHTSNVDGVAHAKANATASRTPIFTFRINDTFAVSVGCAMGRRDPWQQQQHTQPPVHKSIHEKS